MNLIFNIFYTGQHGNAKLFVDEMISSGLVDKIRGEDGNLKYDYYFPLDDNETVVLIDCWKNQEALDKHHNSTMMDEIARLRDKYELSMRFEKYCSYDNCFEAVVKNRTATRKFKDEQVDKDKILKILEAGRLAPTAKNNQPQLIYVASSKEYLDKIDRVSPCRYNAPTVLVVCSDKNKAWTKEDYSTFSMDATIVGTHMMLEATNLGVDNIWVEMFDKKQIKKEFNMDEEVEPICLIPLGYATDDYKGNPLHQSRKGLDETVRFV